MRVYTKQFGEVEVPEERVIRFEAGIVGFPEYKNFFLLDLEDAHPFLWLMSLDEPEFGFPVLPGELIEGYQEELRRYLGGGCWTAYVVVSLGGRPEEATVNLKGPILIDIENRSGRQVVLDDDDLGVAHPLFLEDADTYEKAG